ncbi:hypothetical protein RI129_001758 [Pyrocoelia pectoralis]|uniref:Uncharacterized protein n=1 Tax=Pyrocoelia pectoralis TaxID=417401 RepID=A0AAN7VWA2_9COLE
MDSQLYQFFKNVSYAHFEEEKFLDNFQKAFTEILDQYKNNISNTTVIEQLNDTVSKLIVEFQSLSDKLVNYSINERDQLREDMFRYFNTDFNENSTFRKYFNKEIDSPIFTQIKQFLNSDFKNSSFYKFFENKNVSRYNSEHSKDDLPNFEKLVNVDERVVTNISSLQSNMNTLLNVTFANESHNKVYIMVAWSFAYDKARKGPWHTVALDRFRFHRKIEQFGRILSPVLEKNHRAEVYRNRFQDHTCTVTI